MSQLEKAYEKALPQIRNHVTGLTSSYGVPSKQPTGVLTSSRGEFLKYGIDCSNRRLKVIRAEAQILHPLSLEITEMETEIGARGEVPRFGAKHLEIGVTPRCLFILAERRDAPERSDRKTVRSGGRCNLILGAVELSSKVDPDRVSATVDRIASAC